MREIYLDHNSSVRPLPEVEEAMAKCARDGFGSPSSLHRHGLRARDALNVARERVAALIKAESPEDIIFTSNATEAANLAILGTIEANRRFGGKRVVMSAAEHPSVVDTALSEQARGVETELLSVDAAGAIDLEEARTALTDETMLLCLHQANHDLGTVQPIEQLGKLAAERGTPFFVDASFGAGWLPIDVRAMNASLLSLEPNRFYGPKGVGVLYRRARARLKPILHGGAQEGGRRPGEENLPAIVGAGVAAEIAMKERERRLDRVAILQKRLWAGIRERIRFVRLNGPEPGPMRLPTNLSVSVEFVEGEGVVLRSDLKGLAIASGSACVSKALKIPRALSAIGLDPSLAQGNILLSAGMENTEEEIDAAVDILSGVVEDLRSMSPTWDEFQQGARASLIEPSE